MSLISLKNVQKSYGAHPVLHDITFDVGENEGFAIIGPNGAGKTTLFKVLTGETSASDGTISFDGQNITDVPAFQRIRMGFGRTFQVARVFRDYTALENMVAAIEARMDFDRTKHGIRFAWSPRSATVNEAWRRLDQLHLADKAMSEARILSHGDKKKLELAIALASEPRVLMLDEPTAGMSPAERQQTIRLLQSIRAERNITLMLTEHDMDVVFGLADRLLVLNYGEIIVTGAPEDVRRNPLVAEIYLGKEAGVA